MSEQDQGPKGSTPDANAPAAVKPPSEKLEPEKAQPEKGLKEFEKLVKDDDNNKRLKDRKDSKDSKDKEKEKELTKDRKDRKDSKDSKDKEKEKEKEKELAKDRKDLKERLEKASIQDKGVAEKQSVLDKGFPEKVALEFPPKLDALEKAPEKLVSEEPLSRSAGAPPRGEAGTMEARMDRLEQTVQRLVHFIDAQLRPDLGTSALASEADADEREALSQQLEKNALDAKQAKDAKDTEKPRES